MCASYYTTYLKSGYHNHADIETYAKINCHPRRPNYNYFETLKMWEKTLSHNNMIVRLFEKSSFKNGNVLLDFCDAINLNVDHKFIFPPKQNRSISSFSQRILFLYNIISDNSGNTKNKQELIKVLNESSVKNDTYNLYPNLAKQIQAKFNSCNENLRKEWFPNRTQLFNCDYSKYNKKSITLSEDDEKIIYYLLEKYRDLNIQKISPKKDFIFKYFMNIKRLFRSIVFRKF